ICAAAHAVLAHQRRTPAMAADLAPAALARAVPLGARPAWAAHELTGVKFDMVLKWLSGGLIALALAAFILGQPSSGPAGAAAPRPATRGPQTAATPAMVETKVI